MNNFSITQYGTPPSKDKYSIDYVKKVFTSKEDDLVLDFTYLTGWTFKTGGRCTFITGSDCTFKTASCCTFHTLENCTFETGYSGRCMFNTGKRCIFKTGDNCIFKTGDYCTFETGVFCTFHTGGRCTFTTKSNCTFSIWDINTCTFKSYNYGISTILDRRENEVYKLNKEFIQLRKLANG